MRPLKTVPSEKLSDALGIGNARCDQLHEKMVEILHHTMSEEGMSTSDIFMCISQIESITLEEYTWLIYGFITHMAHQSIAEKLMTDLKFTLGKLSVSENKKN